MYVMLCYDISETRRRSRLFRRLRALLTPVQKSVFEGEIDPRQLPKLENLALEHMDTDTDNVRIYLLCRGCRTSTRLLGTATPLEDPDAPKFA